MGWRSTVTRTGRRPQQGVVNNNVHGSACVVGQGEGLVIWISALEGGKLRVTVGDVYYIWHLDDPLVWRGEKR